jgi:hypothetical protein
MLTLPPSRLVLPLVVGAALFSGGCASNNGPTARAPVVAERPAAEEYPLIVRLVGRHYTVDASSGPDGVVYTASTNEGRTVVANASLDELRQQHPDIYQQILPGIAEHGETRSNSNGRTASDAEPDASVDGPRPLGHSHRGSSTGNLQIMMDARQ